MDDISNWTCNGIDEVGKIVELTTLTISRIDQEIDIQFSGTIKRPIHVLIKWCNHAIVSVININSDRVSLSGNPAELLWNQEKQELHFRVNYDDLSIICFSNKTFRTYMSFFLQHCQNN